MISKKALNTLEIDWEKVEEKLAKTHKDGYLTGFDFSVLIQDLLISKDAYIIDIGNYENVNAVVASSLVNKIKKHPLIWSIFFMVV